MARLGRMARSDFITICRPLCGGHSIIHPGRTVRHILKQSRSACLDGNEAESPSTTSSSPPQPSEIPLCEKVIEHRRYNVSLYLPITNLCEEEGPAEGAGTVAASEAPVRETRCGGVVGALPGGKRRATIRDPRLVRGTDEDEDACLQRVPGVGEPLEPWVDALRLPTGESARPMQKYKNMCAHNAHGRAVRNGIRITPPQAREPAALSHVSEAGARNRTVGLQPRGRTPLCRVPMRYKRRPVVWRTTVSGDVRAQGTTIPATSKRKVLRVESMPPRRRAELNLETPGAIKPSEKPTTSVRTGLTC